MTLSSFLAGATDSTVRSSGSIRLKVAFISDDAGGIATLNVVIRRGLCLRSNTPRSPNVAEMRGATASMTAADTRIPQVPRDFPDALL
ncbi:hypothetical protein ACD578_11490 [Microvirga sp. RSM25]|uniref:hypothetical protein n=1 Tax=Microvirga sp. RSM25 TaxID=3273802 RepID=UPI0038513472